MNRTDPTRVPVGRTFRAAERRRLLREQARLRRRWEWAYGVRVLALDRLDAIGKELKAVTTALDAIDAADAAEAGR